MSVMRCRLIGPKILEARAEIDNDNDNDNDNDTFDEVSTGCQPCPTDSNGEVVTSITRIC